MGRGLRMIPRWLAGMAFTAWRYLWRITALPRRDDDITDAVEGPPIPEELQDELQRIDDGFGHRFHRRFHVNVVDASVAPEEVMRALAGNPNLAAPVEVAVFRKTKGEPEQSAVGDEFVVRMPGPWDGPVRVVDQTPTSFRFATLQGHLEAGQIQFSLEEVDGHLRFLIESWTTAGTRLSAVLYDRVHVMKEMQFHMWTFYCERITRLTGGTLADGVWVTTERQVEGA